MVTTGISDPEGFPSFRGDQCLSGSQESRGEWKSKANVQGSCNNIAKNQGVCCSMKTGGRDIKRMRCSVHNVSSTGLDFGRSGSKGNLSMEGYVCHLADTEH